VLVISLDLKRSPKTKSGYVVTTHGGRNETELDALEWVAKTIELGAGELLVNSIDADGTRAGFDEEMLRDVRSISSVPVIASGGAGKAEDFPVAAAAGADAILAASIFHEGSVTISQAKAALKNAGYETR
jgi:cyclase